MPRAGSLDYPSRGLDDCVSFLRRARAALKSRAMSRDGFARAIGQSPNGGGFGKLVGAMALYGLIETGKNRIATTDLGEQVLFGTNEEQRSGCERSVFGVRLFSEVYHKFGREPSDDQLRIFLRDKAGVQIAVAKRVAGEVGKILRKNSAHLGEGSKTKSRADAADLATSSGTLIGRLEMADYGVLNIRDEISMDLAISLLTQVKKSRSQSESARPAVPKEAASDKTAAAGQ